MTEEEQKNLILNLVISKQGCKATELAVEIAGKADFELISKLVIERRLVEIEYILPYMPYRIKSFLLPKNTQTRIWNGEEISEPKQ